MIWSNGTLHSCHANIPTLMIIIQQGSYKLALEKESLTNTTQLRGIARLSWGPQYLDNDKLLGTVVYKWSKCMVLVAWVTLKTIRSENLAWHVYRSQKVKNQANTMHIKKNHVFGNIYKKTWNILIAKWIWKLYFFNLDIKMFWRLKNIQTLSPMCYEFDTDLKSWNGWICYWDYFTFSAYQP